MIFTRPTVLAAAAWTAANPVLPDKCEGIESDTGKRKLGDGATAWNSLAYQLLATSADVAAVAASVSAAMPPGVILPYGGSSAPAGFLLCDGSAVSRATYAALFAAISTTYGVGNGTTTFNVPDSRGKVIVGVDGSHTLGASGGALTGTPAGTVAAPAFTGAAWTPPAITMSGSTAAEASHTHPVTTNVSGTLTPAGTIAWPVGTPTHSGTVISSIATTSGSVAGSSAGGWSKIGGVAAGSSIPVSVSNQGTNAWPAGVPTFTGTTNQALTISNPAVTSGAGSSHLHDAGTLAASIATYTPAGSNSAPAFSGSSMSIEQPWLACNSIIKT